MGTDERERADGGRYAPAATPEDVLDVFDAVRGPAITATDVAEVLDCSREVARKRLGELEDAGKVERRKSGRTVLWWRVVNESNYDRAIGIFTEDDAAAMKEERERLRREWGEHEDAVSGQ